MNLIKQKLRLKKKSQGWLSQKTGIDRRHLSRIVRDEAIPLLKTAVKISRALDSPVEEVFIFPED